MSHSTPHRTSVDLSREEGPAVKSALKAALVRELSEQASTPGATIGGTATPEHMASPGRLHTSPRS